MFGDNFMMFRVMYSILTGTFENSDLAPSLGLDTCHVHGEMHAISSSTDHKTSNGHT